MGISPLQEFAQNPADARVSVIYRSWPREARSWPVYRVQM